MPSNFLKLHGEPSVKIALNLWSPDLFSWQMFGLAYIIVSYKLFELVVNQ